MKFNLPGNLSGMVDVTDKVKENYPSLWNELQSYRKGNFNDSGSNDYYIFYPNDTMKDISRGMCSSHVGGWIADTLNEWGWVVDNKSNRIFCNNSEMGYFDVPSYDVGDDYYDYDDMEDDE